MSTQLGVNYNLYKTVPSTSPGGGTILARVDRVIYGPRKSDGSRDEAFYNNNQWNSVGGILYTVMYGSENVPQQASTVAKPYDGNITHYPLEGEIVELTPGPSTKLNDDALAKDLYYRTPINLWNNVHHNAFPSFFKIAGFNNNLQVPYADSTKGVAKSNVTSSQVVPLGSTFVEQTNIKNLQAFEGDIIYQGRWGQSIRFGSTVSNSAIKNPWSSGGQNGLPITIIRNGQSTRFIGPTDPWTPTIEDINSDGASIYLCSGQVIRISDIEQNHVPNMKSFTSKSKPQENQIQRPVQQPVSTDSTSARQQSQSELQAAQASANNVSNQATRSNK
jgi:hypothetical protein